MSADKKLIEMGDWTAEERARAHRLMPSAVIFGVPDEGELWRLRVEIMKEFRAALKENIDVVAKETNNG